jgi:hypothetical protein
MHHVVTFADVNLSELARQENKSNNLRRRDTSSFVQDQLSADPDHEWPLMRYFNAATGMDGAPYVRKLTDVKLCYDFGNNYIYMLDFIDEAAQTSLCAADETNCDDLSIGYLRDHRRIASKGGGGSELYAAELETLQQEYDSGSRDPWIWQRQQIIKALLSEESTAEEL